MWPLLISAAVGIGQSIFGAVAQSNAAHREREQRIRALLVR